jgi:hypothetical protein
MNHAAFDGYTCGLGDVCPMRPTMSRLDTVPANGGSNRLHHRPGKSGITAPISAIRRSETGPHSVDIAVGNPVKMLFGRGYALQTVLLWIIYFCSLLNLFLFVYWLPEVLHLTGMTPPQAVFASSIIPLGGIVAVFYLGLLIDRFGPERALALHYAVGVVFVALIALVALPYFALLTVIFLAGTTIIGSQTGLSGACGKLYPARMRTSGIGWAIGIGRIGGIVSPILGGWLLARGLPPTQIFLSACTTSRRRSVPTASGHKPWSRSRSPHAARNPGSHGQESPRCRANTGSQCRRN